MCGNASGFVFVCDDVFNVFGKYITYMLQIYIFLTLILRLKICECVFFGDSNLVNWMGSFAYWFDRS